VEPIVSNEAFLPSLAFEYPLDRNRKSDGADGDDDGDSF